MNSTRTSPYAAIPHWLRPITRRPGEVQFGVLEGGPIVSGVTPDEARLLARLDGTMPPDALGLVAKASGVSKRRWQVLLDLVVRLGLLEPGPVERSDTPPRGAARATAAGSLVLVDGDCCFAHELRHLLGRPSAGAASIVLSERPAAAGGVNWVDVREPADALEAGEAGDAAAVVLVAELALDPRRGDLWLQRGVPHLPVVVSGSRALVGPWVDGTTASPCLWCLDLHRSDRDAAWPTVMTQVAGVPTSSAAAPPDPRGGSAAQPSSATGLSQLVAGAVAALVGQSLAGATPPAGVSVDVSVPWPRLDHRRWRVHPRCRQHASRAGAGPRVARGGSGAA
jgi:hypothetical protein